VLIGILTLSKLQVNSRLILLLVISATLPQILTYRTTNNATCIIYNIYIPIEYGILFFFFKVSFFSKRGKKIFYVLGILGFLMAVYFFGFVGLTERFISEWVCFNNIIYTAWILLLVLEIYEDDAIFLNQQMSLFWYLLGMFFYASCTILIFCFWYYITVIKNRYFEILFQIYGLFNIFMYIAFSVGLLLDVSNTLKKNKKASHVKP
jgi:hypothetical protein